jgi:hypothetical protein
MARGIAPPNDSNSSAKQFSELSLSATDRPWTVLLALQPATDRGVSAESAL